MSSEIQVQSSNIENIKDVIFEVRGDAKMASFAPNKPPKSNQIKYRMNKAHWAHQRKAE